MKFISAKEDLDMIRINFPEMQFPIQGLDEVVFPKMVRIRQLYDNTKIEDIPAYLREALNAGDYKDQVNGKRIALTVGSRGIPDNLTIVKTICDKLKDWGAEPFIVPAMGSHGGGTVEGNLEILEGYGITEENTGVPVLASMDVVEIGRLEDGVTPVYCDRIASEADGIVVYNKVKPHTDFKGEHESGLLKMMAIGLAKHKGCSALH
jgi:nickel-dependent lactate racemase